MANIIDYVQWRGDIPLSQVPFGGIDALILSYLSYMPFAGILNSSMQGGGTLLGDAAQALLNLNAQEHSKLAYSEKEDRQLLAALRESERFAGTQLIGYVDQYDRATQKQFSAVTFLLPDGTAFAAFRGTDDTVVGWKENFNMTFDREVPAQRDAVAYVQALYKARALPLRLGGHSKGGNLAVYAGMCCADTVREAILAVYNFDGPGFNEEVAASPAFSRLGGRVKTFVTQSSLIGILLWHNEPFTIIKSDSVSVFQHNVYTWQLMGGRFIELEERSGSSLFADATLKRWLAEMAPTQREAFINGVYSVIAAGDGRNVVNLFEGHNLMAMIKAAGSMDERTRADVQEAFRLLGEAVKENASAQMERTAEAFVQRVRGERSEKEGESGFFPEE